MIICEINRKDVRFSCGYLVTDVLTWCYCFIPTIFSFANGMFLSSVYLHMLQFIDSWNSLLLLIRILQRKFLRFSQPEKWERSSSPTVVQKLMIPRLVFICLNDRTIILTNSFSGHSLCFRFSIHIDSFNTLLSERNSLPFTW